MNSAGAKLLKVAGVGALTGPIILLASDLVHIFAGYSFEWSIGLWVAMLLMIPAVIGLTYMLVSRGSQVAFFGGLSAFFGLMAGASMQVLFRVHAVLEEQGNLQAVEQLRSTFKLVASTQMIGLTWPIGLILLAIGYYRYGPANNALVSALLLVGAIAFPIGRIAFSSAGVIISGAVFVIAFGMIASHLFAMARSHD